MIQPYTFTCISDVEVPDRIPLKHDWPGWWSKIELFNNITDETLYLDLDTVITGPLEPVIQECRKYDFAMLENFHTDAMVGSGVMWVKPPAPRFLYDLFVQSPQRIIDYYLQAKIGPYMGDQAYIWDRLDRKVPTIKMPEIRSYKKHCRNGLPEGTSIVCFHGRPRPTEINPDWMKEHWK
jgi:hypothetical protein